MMTLPPPWAARKIKFGAAVRLKHGEKSFFAKAGTTISKQIDILSSPIKQIFLLIAFHSPFYFFTWVYLKHYQNNIF